MPAEPYSPQLLEHYRNPRNVGVIQKPDGSATRENEICGDVLEISVKVEANAVKEIRFKAEGCIPTIALASYATQWAEGKKLGEIQKLNPAQLSTALGELPRHKLHSALLVVETLRAAIANSFVQ
jgi:nitrogen fixation NifU-like protein